jgi:glutamine synthetase
MFGYSLTRPVHNQEYYYGIFDTCEKFRCGIEGWHTESGPGVFEAVGLSSLAYVLFLMD